MIGDFKVPGRNQNIQEWCRLLRAAHETTIRRVEDSTILRRLLPWITCCVP